MNKNNDLMLRRLAQIYIPFSKQAEDMSRKRVEHYPQIATYLYDICCGRLSDEQIVHGFIRYYAAYHLTLEKVTDDLMQRTHSYRDYEIKAIIVSIQEALSKY